MKPSINPSTVPSPTPSALPTIDLHPVLVISSETEIDLEDFGTDDTTDLSDDIKGVLIQSLQEIIPARTEVINVKLVPQQAVTATLRSGSTNKLNVKTVREIECDTDGCNEQNSIVDNYTKEFKQSHLHLRYSHQC
jgi:hypothetical protein